MACFFPVQPRLLRQLRLRRDTHGQYHKTASHGGFSLMISSRRPSFSEPGHGSFQAKIQPFGFQIAMEFAGHVIIQGHQHLVVYLHKGGGNSGMHQIFLLPPVR